MKTRSQNINLNVALKVAIVQSRRKSFVIARHVRITPDRLSQIVNGHRSPTDREMKALAKTLDRPVSELFPQQSDAVA